MRPMLVIVALLSLAACSHKKSGPICTPGVMAPCTCPDGKASTALCSLNGEALDCECSDMGGSSCDMACASGTVCKSGACITAPIGAACSANSDCGETGVCVPAAAGYPGGYCLEPCQSDSDCAGGACQTTSGGSYCLAGCSGEVACRTGYTCAAASSGDPTTICIPPCAVAPALLCGAYACSSDGVHCVTDCTGGASSCSTNSTCATDNICSCSPKTDCGANRACVTVETFGTTAIGGCGCANDAACSTGQTCDTKSGTCG